jgi:hypothetical protein
LERPHGRGLDRKPKGDLLANQEATRQGTRLPRPGRFRIGEINERIYRTPVSIHVDPIGVELYGLVLGDYVTSR